MPTHPTEAGTDELLTDDVPALLTVPVLVTEPVAIIEHRPRTVATGHVPASSSEVRRIVGANPVRVRLLLRNLGTVAVHLGATEHTADPVGGFPILAGESIVLNATSAWYARADAAAVADVDLAFLAESLDG